MDKIIEFFKTDTNALISAGKSILFSLIFLVIIVNVINLIFKRITKKAKERGQATNHISVIKYVILTVFYIAAIADIFSAIPGLSSMLKTLLAGSGVAAIVLTIAAQEPISNLVAGIIIFSSKPFVVGDLVRYLSNNISGVVESITLRHTVIRTFENKRLIIPNAIMNSGAVENATHATDPICNMLDFNITHESDINLAMSIISDVILLHPDYYDNRSEEEVTAGVAPVRVLISDFTNSGVVLRAWVWSKTPLVAMFMKHDILMGVKERFDENNIKFAYPHVAVVNND